jgi:geranylgeranyl pyrophosphate synthase
MIEGDIQLGPPAHPPCKPPGRVSRERPQDTLRADRSNGAIPHELLFGKNPATESRDGVVSSRRSVLVSPSLDETTIVSQPPIDQVSDLHPQLESLHRVFVSEIGQVDRDIVAYLDQFDRPQTHYGIVRYHFGYANSDLRPLPADEYLPRGKRLRPLICMLFCRMFALDNAVAAVVMMATEIMHSASLAHDDIQDKDAVRWGRPTIHALFGPDQAINTGDAMIGMVYHVLLTLRSRGVTPDILLDVLEVFNDAHLRMCEGQHLDLRYRFFDEVDLAEYLDMVSRKTASPCVCIADAISTLAACPQPTRETLHRFGLSLGMLYQICDDIRGIWCAPQAFGRQTGQDINQQRSSLPLLHAFRYGSAELREFLCQKASRPEPLSDAELAVVREEMAACGTSRYCREQATTQYEAALEALESLHMDCHEVQMLRGILRTCVASVDLQV